MADALTCESENQGVVVTHLASRPKGHFKSSPVHFLRYIFTFFCIHEICNLGEVREK